MICMKGVLILAHGSRRKETENTLKAVIGALKEELEQTGEVNEIETAFLQFSERNLHAGLKALTDKGVEEIVVAPYFLFEGIHILEDIPDEIAGFTKQYPHIKIRLAKPLGKDKRLAMILKDRIMELI